MSADATTMRQDVARAIDLKWGFIVPFPSVSPRSRGTAEETANTEHFAGHLPLVRRALGGVRSRNGSWSAGSWLTSEATKLGANGAFAGPRTSVVVVAERGIKALTSNDPSTLDYCQS
jgi:hypothetical protein